MYIPSSKNKSPIEPYDLWRWTGSALDPQGLGWLNASAGEEGSAEESCPMQICYPKPIQSMYGIFTYI